MSLYSHSINIKYISLLNKKISKANKNDIYPMSYSIVLNTIYSILIGMLHKIDPSYIFACYHLFKKNTTSRVFTLMWNYCSGFRRYHHMGKRKTSIWFSSWYTVCKSSINHKIMFVSVSSRLFALRRTNHRYNLHNNTKMKFGLIKSVLIPFFSISD